MSTYCAWCHQLMLKHQKAFGVLTRANMKTGLVRCSHEVRVRLRVTQRAFSAIRAGQDCNLRRRGFDIGLLACSASCAASLQKSLLQEITHGGQIVVVS